MISIRVSQKWVDSTRKKLDAYANRKFRARVYYMFEEMLLVGAQYSGDYVSNFRIVTQSDAMPSYREGGDKNTMQIDDLFRASIDPHQAGDAPAILEARAAVARKPFSYKDKIYFVNPAPLYFTGTDVTGRDGITQPLRPENLIDGGKTLKVYMQGRFGRDL